MITDFLIKTLTPRIAPMVYVMMFVSVIIGFCFLTGFLVAPAESILYSTSFFLDRALWGLLLFVLSGTAEIGLVTKIKPLVMIGSMGSFILWLFACIGLILGAHYYAFLIFGLFHLIFQIYVYLAESLDVLERTAIGRYRNRKKTKFWDKVI